MNVIDLFSGVGGFSCGLEKAGYNILVANEIDEQISKSYVKNHKSTIMLNCDISEFNTKFTTLKLNTSKIDLVVGGPPCQGFSMAGARIRKNNFIEDPRNYLFKKYFDVIKNIEPNFFIMENVIGLASMNGGAIIREIENIFKDDTNFKKGGYYIQKKVFETDRIGVPQKRKRFIIIGSKLSFNLDEIIKKVYMSNGKFTEQSTLSDAISDLTFGHEDNYFENQKYIKIATNNYQKLMRANSKIVRNHIIFNHSKIVKERIKKIKPGENWKSLKETIKSVHSGAYGRLEWNKPAMTITTRFDTPSAGRFIHPSEHRTITVREAARIQSFPDDFIFYGNKTSICKQIGNAVPPYLGEFLGLIIKQIKNDNKGEN